jgi:diaminopimelate decarboxylase
LAIAGRAINFARAYSRFANSRIDWIDFGGGFPDSSVSPIGATLWNPPEIEQFARATLGLLENWDGPTPSLIFEPGRALIGPCVDLYSRVETVKKVAGVQVATLDAGVNTLPFARAFSYPVELCEARNTQSIQTVLCGPLCMADDVIRFDADLPPLVRGDLLRIRGVGAYNIGMSFDFIRRRADVFFMHRERLLRTKSMFSP